MKFRNESVIYLRRPSSVLQEHFDLLTRTRRKTSCGVAHGDLNGRNVMVDAMGAIHVIDFSTLRYGAPLFLDATRLEVELKFRIVDLASPGDVDAFCAIEELLLDSLQRPDPNHWQAMPLEPRFAMFAQTATAVRTVAAEIAGEVQQPRPWQEQYLEGLAAQTLRIALRPDYLTDRQREAAILSSALLLDQLMTNLRGSVASTVV